MTDIEKIKNIFDNLGIDYKEKQQEKIVSPHETSNYKFNLNDKIEVEYKIEINEGIGYYNFYTEFLFDKEGNFYFRPFVYGWKKKLNLETWTQEYVPDPDKKRFIYFLTKIKK